MGICTDKSTTYLKQLGYNVVRHPREGIRPLDLIGRQHGEVIYLGRLDKLLTTPDGALPPIRSNQEAADIVGQSSSKLPLAIGLNVLNAVLSALGTGAGVKAAYNQAKSIQFVFGRVLFDSAAPLEIGSYLKRGEIDVDNPILNQYVMGNGNLYVITDVIKTNKFTVKAEDSSGAELKLDVPALKELVGIDVEVSHEAGSSGAISYEGKKMLTFGFKCIQIGWTDEGMKMVSVKAGSVAMAAGDTGAAPVQPSILEPLGLLDIEF